MPDTAHLFFSFELVKGENEEIVWVFSGRK